MGERARQSAKLRGLEGHCEFRIQDKVNVDLSVASVVLLHGPPAAVGFMQKRVLPRSGLPQGATIFSVGAPLPDASCAVARVSPPEFELQGLFCYYVCQDMDTTRDRPQIQTQQRRHTHQVRPVSQPCGTSRLLVEPSSPLANENTEDAMARSPRACAENVHLEMECH